MKRYLLALGIWGCAGAGAWLLWAPDYPLSRGSEIDWPTSGQQMAPSDSSSSADSRIGRRGGEGSSNRPLPVREEHSALPALKHEIAQLKAELAALRHDLQSIKGQGVERQDEPGLESDAEKSVAILEAEAMEARQHAEEQRKQRLNDIDALLRSESVDPGWSQQAVAQINRVLAEERFEDSYLVAVDCRSTLCRLEVEHDDPDAASAFVNAFPGQVADMFPQVTFGNREQGNGYGDVILYLVRQGYRLPLWENSA